VADKSFLGLYGAGRMMPSSDIFFLRGFLHGENATVAISRIIVGAERESIKLMGTMCYGYRSAIEYPDVWKRYLQNNEASMKSAQAVNDVKNHRKR
jgi:hypothetical protein